MSILTDEEIREIGFGSQSIKFARAIEALLMSKLAEQAGEPLGTANDLIDDYVLSKTNINPNDRLYTEAQYLAAQQRTAEACAKVCDRQAKEHECPERATYCAEAIRNNWRECL